jgi:hypothetical protein
MQIEKTNGNDTESQMTSFIGSLDYQNFTARIQNVPGPRTGKPTRHAAQEQLAAWRDQCAKRDRLRHEIKRGKEVLADTRQQLDDRHARLDQWAVFERTCGPNGLESYMQSILALERIQHFLPTWVKRRENQLRVLEHQMKAFGQT